MEWKGGTAALHDLNMSTGGYGRDNELERMVNGDRWTQVYITLDVGESPAG